MEPDRFAAFTDELVSKVAADDRAVGLVLLGSTADTVRGPDAWSDHDVWLIARAGQGAALRATIDWLPSPDDVVVSYGESEHGRSVIYADGHLVEYAVFEVGELDVASANVFTVAYDEIDLTDRMAAMAERTRRGAAATDIDGHDRFGAFMGQLTIGITREARGEHLSANHLIRGWAPRTLASLLAAFVPAGDRVDVGDNLDPNRRFELLHPELAAEIGGALGMPLLAGAERLLDIAERELSDRVEGVTPLAFAALRATLGRANAAA